MACTPCTRRISLLTLAVILQSTSVLSFFPVQGQFHTSSVSRFCFEHHILLAGKIDTLPTGTLALSMVEKMPRRAVLGLVPAVYLSARPLAVSAEDDLTYLQKRMERKGPNESMPPPLPFGGDNQLYWPRWVFGSWTARSTLSEASFPSGVPLDRLTAVCNSVELSKTMVQDLHFFSTLADSSRNNMRVTLGLGVPEAEIIEDRQYNYRTDLETGSNLKVQEASYDPRADPTFVSLELEKGPSGFVRKNYYIENRKSANAVLDDGRPAWYGSETIRSVAVGPKKVQGSRSMKMTRFRSCYGNARCDAAHH